ncbi:2-phospho-L-lactate transferase [Novosphingobium sp. ZW T3_23]|uniref:2-phospho-L-lactate transferase n=1 Tax=Novosphingobium sp. ZW T3_23 TaxID=3378084 RepID=UPI0038554BEF
MSGKHILALSGGVGGAKLAAGLAAVTSGDDLTIVVNTGDDFEHLGLTICPDMDSVTYALAGLNDNERGWGVENETWQAMAMLRALGEEGWFNLGDRDLAMHIARSWRLRAGETLSQVTARLTRELGIDHAVVPMSDDLVRTQVLTDAGWIDFQRWFVGNQCADKVFDVRFEGAQRARPAPEFRAALERDDLAAIVLCPSNPFLSVDPILSIPGVRDALAERQVPLIAVSPIIGGSAVKGPLAKMLAERGQVVNNLAIARHYQDHWGDLLDCLLIDHADEADVPVLQARGLTVAVTRTLMREAADRERLAKEVLAIAGI